MIDRDTLRTILFDFDKGKELKIIAELNAMSMNDLYELLEANGRKLHRPNNLYRRKKKICEDMRKQGYPLKAIAERLQITVQSVTYYFND